MTSEIELLSDETLPILHGQATPQVEHRVRQFLFSIPEIYESWLGRRTSPHTRRAYDQDVMNFVRDFLSLSWPEDSNKLLQVSVQTVQAYRDSLVSQNAAPKTINPIELVFSKMKHLVRSAAAVHNDYDDARLPLNRRFPTQNSFVV